MIRFYDARGTLVSEIAAKRYRRMSMTAAANHRQMDEQKRIYPEIVKAVLPIGGAFLFDANGRSYSTLFSKAEG